MEIRDCHGQAAGQQATLNASIKPHDEQEIATQGLMLRSVPDLGDGHNTKKAGSTNIGLSAVAANGDMLHCQGSGIPT